MSKDTPQNLDQFSFILFHDLDRHQLSSLLLLRGSFEDVSTPGRHHQPEVPKCGGKSGNKGEHDGGAGEDAAHCV